VPVLTIRPYTTFGIAKTTMPKLTDNFPGRIVRKKNKPNITGLGGAWYPAAAFVVTGIF